MLFFYRWPPPRYYYYFFIKSFALSCIILHWIGVDVHSLKEPKPGKRSLYMQSPTPSDLVYGRTYYHTYTPSPTYSPTAPGGYSYSQSQDAMHAKPLLFAKIALHCYNLEKVISLFLLLASSLTIVYNNMFFLFCRGHTLNAWVCLEIMTRP